MQRIYTIGLAVAVTLAAGFCVLIIVSLIPHFALIGWLALILVVVALLCCCTLLIAGTWLLVGIMSNRRHLLIAGDIVAYLGRGNEIIHLSAEHERAKLPLPQTTIKEIAGPAKAATADKETVMELFDKGIALRTIAESTGLTYYQVQKMTSAKSND